MVKDCVNAHLEAYGNKVDVKYAFSATERWERTIGSPVLVMSDWREKLSEAVAKIGKFKVDNFQPAQSTGDDKGTIELFIDGLAVLDKTRRNNEPLA